MKKILFVVLFSVLMLSALAAPALSQVTIGIGVDDRFVYEGTVESTREGGYVATPDWLNNWIVLWNNTEWIKRNVTAINDQTISFDILTRYENGTEVPSTQDETIGEGYSRWVIGTDTEEGDQIGTLFGESTPLLVNGTITIEYGDDERETLWAGWNALSSGQYFAAYCNYYDKEFGIIVKQTVTAVVMSGEATLTVNIVNELVETTCWVIPEFPTGLMMLFAFVALAVCVDLYRRKQLNNDRINSIFSPIFHSSSPATTGSTTKTHKN